MSGGLGSVVKFVVKRHKRDIKHLEQLFGDHSQALLDFVRQRAELCGFDPEDVMQEVFARLAANTELMQRMRDGSVNTRPYLFQMANNLLVDLIRRRSTRTQYESNLKQEWEASRHNVEHGPESAVIAQKDLDLLKKVIVDLKPAWREAFLLNRFEGMSYSEISVRMGVTKKQVENYMARALIRIKRAQERLERY